MTSRRIRSGGSSGDLVERLLAVGGGHRLVAEILQLLFQVVHVEGLIVDKILDRSTMGYFGPRNLVSFADSSSSFNGLLR